MSDECYKNAMTQHFKARLKSRVGVNITKEQRKDIIDSVQGKGPYKSSFSGRTGDAHRSWFLVSFDGVGIYVLYDNKYNKLVTCLSYKDKPIEALQNDLRQANKQLEADLLVVDKARKRIVELEAEIKEREGKE